MCEYCSEIHGCMICSGMLVCVKRSEIHVCLECSGMEVFVNIVVRFMCV